MTLVDTPVQRTIIRSIEDLDQIDAIQNATTEAIIWTRTLSSSIQDLLDKLTDGNMPEGQFVLKLADIRSCISQLFTEAGHASHQGISWLIDDIVLLAGELGRTFESSYIRIRIETITDDACRKFHTDNVEARLICTYSGPGTEYGFCHNGGEPDRIFRVPTGQPILLKGMKWPGDVDRFLKHRSPPIAGRGVTRLVVAWEPVINPLEELLPIDTVLMSQRYNPTETKVD